MSSAPRVIAHRGFSGVAPENTLAAFRRALQSGADMIELDVLLSRDNELIVIHDATLERTTNGAGAVAEHTLAELRQLDAGSWFAPEFAGEPVPTLGEVIVLLGSEVPLNIEIKGEAVTDQVAGGITERVIAAVRDAGLEREVVLSSFDVRALRHARAIDAGIARAALWESTVDGDTDPLELVAAVEAIALHVDWPGVTPELIEACRGRGTAVAVYTIDEVADLRRAIALGVDGVFTNWPPRLRGLLSC